MQGLPEYMITHTDCELLPHIFILTRRQLFSVALSVILITQDTRLFTGALLFAVRTFLLPPLAGSDSLACSGDKDNFFRKTLIKPLLLLLFYE